MKKNFTIQNGPSHIKLEASEVWRTIQKETGKISGLTDAPVKYGLDLDYDATTADEPEIWPPINLPC